MRVYAINGMQEAEYVGTFEVGEQLLRALRDLLSSGRPVYVEPVGEE